MPFTPPPPAPQRSDRATFSQRVDAFLTWLVALIPQLAVFESNLSAFSAGSANAFPYVFSGGTDDTDPGNGRLRFFGASQSTATILRIDTMSSNGANVLPIINALIQVTSNVKGSIRLQSASDISKWIIFNVTGAAPAAGYGNLIGSVSTSSAPGNIFSPEEQLVVFFSFNGDKGDGGGTPTEQQIRDAIGTLPIANGGTASTTAAGARQSLGLGNVDNTSDINKPVSTAQASAIGERLSRLTGGVMQDHIDFVNTKGIFMRDSAGNSRQLVKMDGDVVNFTVAGGTGINYYNQAGNMVVASLSNTGTWTAIKNTATSDETLKDNWRDVPDDFLERFAAIERAGLFDWSDSGETDGGIGAQSVREIAPWCVVEIDGKLRVNHAALNTVVSHALTRRVLRNEVK